jgi:anthranilate phosphoribosyltransferase
MKAVLEQLLNGRHLTRQEASALLEDLASGRMEPAVAGAVLAALRSKGETADELAGFAAAMRRLAKQAEFPEDSRPLVDVVGTGGDASSSYNLSTGSALLAAACGVRIAKHGNRSISSICGSADVLEALGLPLPLDERDAAACLERTGFTFLFAPHYHPAMAAIAPVRRALGVRTIFNMLGPLTNPALPPFGVIGAFSLEVARTMAGALAALEIRRYFVIHGAEGWDEATPVGPFTILDVVPGAVQESSRDPREWGMSRCLAEELRGGDAAFNAAGLRAAFNGEQVALRDALVLGAALAMEVCGKAPGPSEGVEMAGAAIDDGRAAALLDAIAEFGAAMSGNAVGGRDA